jgi:hypothetical protein
VEPPTKDHATVFLPKHMQVELGSVMVHYDGGMHNVRELVEKMECMVDLENGLRSTTSHVAS